MTDPLEQARQRFLDGLALFEAERLDEAEASFEAALAHAPGRVSVLVNLAATRNRLGRPQAALPLLDDALAAAADDADAWLQRGIALGALRRHADALAAYEQVVALAPGDAGAWLRHGQALQHAERHDEAMASYDRALMLDPALAPAWTQRADLLKQLGRVDEAAAALRQALALGGDPALNGWYLAALTGDAAPRSPPRAYVERLFDDYAETFDAHLVGKLGYRAHRLLLEPLQAQRRDAPFESALDLGCGTGLCGPLIKAVARRVDGIDLSAPMLAQARVTRCYERLEQADLVAHLQSTEHRHDLVVAADVFIYVGDLQAVFAGVRRVLRAGGMFCFSAEQASERTIERAAGQATEAAAETAADSAGFELLPSLRYAHSERCLRALAAQNGFEIERLVSQPIREEQRRPIAGWYAYLRKV
jgi:predicted TPR repeat methyltransferase